MKRGKRRTEGAEEKEKKNNNKNIRTEEIIQKR